MWVLQRKGLVQRDRGMSVVIRSWSLRHSLLFLYLHLQHRWSSKLWHKEQHWKRLCVGATNLLVISERKGKWLRASSTHFRWEEDGRIPKRQSFKEGIDFVFRRGALTWMSALDSRSQREDAGSKATRSQPCSEHEERHTGSHNTIVVAQYTDFLIT